MKRAARLVIAYGIFVVFCYMLYRVIGTVDDWRYWSLTLMTILYGAVLSWDV